MSKLYLLTQNKNTGYDTYDSAVVCADSLKKAKEIDPSGFRIFHDNQWYFQTVNGEHEDYYNSWALPKDITAVCIGEANRNVKKGEVVCASFNAG